MSNEQSNCSVCGTPFKPELTYQVEARSVSDANGERRTEHYYYCSLDCVSKSHGTESSHSCDVCGRAFVVELVSQVINHRGRRFHACSGDCRHQLLDRLNGPSLRAVVPPPVESEPMRLSAIEPPIPTPVPPSATRVASTATAIPIVPNPAKTPLSRGATPVASRPSAKNHVTTQPSSPPPGERETASTDVQWQRIQATLGGRTQVVAVFNHKGGTGKTTTAVTLAAGLASKGRKVLLVDTDGQGNVGVSLGMQNERTLYHVLVMGLDPKEAIVEVRPNLYVLPSNETLAAAELYIAGRPNRDRILANRLAAMRSEYDVIVVDCSPSLSLMNQNALVFADGVLCPVACDYLSLVGVRQVLRTIKQVNRLLSHPVRLWGVLPTLYDARARVCVEAYDTLRQHFGDRCMSPIRMASRAKEAPSQSQTLFEYAPDATATKDYWQVVDQLYDDSSPNAESLENAAVGGVK
jgi:chromosome partitioning protein